MVVYVSGNNVVGGSFIGYEILFDCYVDNYNDFIFNLFNFNVCLFYRIDYDLIWID